MVSPESSCQVFMSIPRRLYKKCNIGRRPHPPLMWPGAESIDRHEGKEEERTLTFYEYIQRKLFAKIEEL